MNYSKAESKLKSEYRFALNQEQVNVDERIKTFIDSIVENSEKSKGVLAVVITSLLKKILTPEQDIRIHQHSMDGGYSGRGLDTKVVTPFLKAQNFPAMSESGWLTRSLEQAMPYTFEYSGSIRPNSIKNSFLKIINLIQTEDVDPAQSLRYVLKKLIIMRDRNLNLNLFKPSGKTISEINNYLEKHFSIAERGASRLPTLALYAVYQQMLNEVSKFKNCILLDLQPHNSPDRRAGYIGDIQVNTVDGVPFEAVEVKHGIEIDLDTLKESYLKFQTEPVKTYYLLSTCENIRDIERITTEIISIRKTHGCQVIINGVLCSLRYYLRLLKDTDVFLRNYVSLVECDSALSFNIRFNWNEVVNE